jgi:hypothetical protein
MRIADLVKKRLVRAAPKANSLDGREKAYVLTKRGDERAAHFYGVLVLLEREIRHAAGIKANARSVDPQRIALSLSACTLSRESAPVGIDRRRTAGVLRAKRPGRPV